MIHDSSVGVPVRRREDDRFIRGNGRYVADLQAVGDLRAVFRRSEHAHARILAIDTAAAAAAPGVVSVFTGKDLLAGGVGNLPGSRTIIGKDGFGNKAPPRFPLCIDRVRYVGDPVAVVIAETDALAQDAAELIKIDYETLPAMIALSDTATVWDEVPGNLCCEWEIGDRALVDVALTKAAHIVEIALLNNRISCSPMEPRAARAEWSASSGRYTLYTTSQNPHLVKGMICDGVLPIREHQLRVVAPDVGGGFGCKLFLYPEEVVVTWAVTRLRRAVGWTSTRSESLLSDIQARDHTTTARLGLATDGTFMGLSVHTKANLGAYLSQGGTEIPTYYYAPLLSGAYRIPNIHCQVDLIFTNTTPVDAYRGAGRPEAAYVLERLIDKAAAELGLNRITLRRRNFISANAYPYETPLGITYDSGHHEATLALALERADQAGFAERRAASEARGMRRGMGFSTYLEIAGGCPVPKSNNPAPAATNIEAAEIRVSPAGAISVFCGTHSQGQGHETTFAQIVSSKLGVPYDAVSVIEGDTDLIVYGRGASASRSLVIGGSAILRATEKIILKGRKIAAHVLGEALERVHFESGWFKVEGSNAALSFEEVVVHAYAATVPPSLLEPGLTESAFYEPENWTYPGGCHICEVEVDPETGLIQVDRVTAVDDVGVVINPMVVEGQIHGGLAQGLGQALMENTSYDPETGQPLTGSFMDYAMPRAADLPSFDSSTYDSICAHNPTGAKGCAEAGTVGVPPALVNAVVDALQPLGVTHLEMPLTPLRVWEAIRSAGSR